MTNWKPVDWVIVLLTLTIVSFIVMIEYMLLVKDPVSEHGSKLITGLITSITSMISMFIGAKIQERRDKDE